MYKILFIIKRFTIYNRSRTKVVMLALNYRYFLPNKKGKNHVQFKSKYDKIK